MTYRLSSAAGHMRCPVVARTLPGQSSRGGTRRQRVSHMRRILYEITSTVNSL
jgi:hypothetical protein